jgi:hypothetical protein
MQVLAWIGEGAGSVRDDIRFEALALETFRFQYARNPAYRRLCQALGVRPDSVQRWQDIPSVPTGAFKEARLATFPEEEEIRTFRTSGSTSQRRGALHLDTLEVYEASLLASFDAYVCAGWGRMRFAVLAPSETDAPDSSLSYMFSTACREFGTPDSRFYATRDGWHLEQAIADLQEAKQPVAVLGTAFAFVHLLDILAGRGIRLALADGSRVMETGGFKGRSRELTREVLHSGLSIGLGVPHASIINQYGMCELGSQFYEPSLANGIPTRTKKVPPWVRTRVVDPATMTDVASGETGILLHYDLANTGSVIAVQTSDIGRSLEDGFEVMGRLQGAEARGCSIAADILLGGP